MKKCERCGHPLNIHKLRGTGETAFDGGVVQCEREWCELQTDLANHGRTNARRRRQNLTSVGMFH